MNTTRYSSHGYIMGREQERTAATLHLAQSPDVVHSLPQQYRRHQSFLHYWIDRCISALGAINQYITWTDLQSKQQRYSAASCIHFPTGTYFSGTGLSGTDFFMPLAELCSMSASHLVTMILNFQAVSAEWKYLEQMNLFEFQSEDFHGCKCIILLNQWS